MDTQLQAMKFKNNSNICSRLQQNKDEKSYDGYRKLNKIIWWIEFLAPKDSSNIF